MPRDSSTSGRRATNSNKHDDCFEKEDMSNLSHDRDYGSDCNPAVDMGCLWEIVPRSGTAALDGILVVRKHRLLSDFCNRSCCHCKI